MSRLAPLVLGLLLLGCQGERPSSSATADDGTYFVLAGEAAVYDEPGGTVVGQLRFGQLIEEGVEEGGWVRFLAGEFDRWVARNRLESSEERRVRERETAEVLSLPHHPAVVTRSVPMTWWPVFDAPVLGRLEKGARVKVFAAHSDYYAIELADDGAEARRYVAYIPSDSVEWEPAPLTEIASQVTQVVVATTLEHEVEADSALEDAYAEATAELIPPTPLHRSEPIYPRAARQAGAGGTVELRLLIDERGQVGRVEVLKGERDDLIASAVRAVRTWSYRPARRAGRPIPVWKVVQIRFSP